MLSTFFEYHLLQILKQFDNQHLPFDLFLSHYFKSHKALGSKDRNQIAENAYGMIRWLTLLDHLLDGAPTWEKRYAIFRGFQPANYLYLNNIPLHVRVSFPQELFECLRRDYGEDKAIEFCQVSNSTAPITIRVNPLKTTRDELLKRWQQTFYASPCEYAPYGIRFKKRLPLTAQPEFKNGFFEIQDEGSQLVAELVQAKPGDQVLDYCAGSGGKTLAFAHRLQNSGQIYLHDVRPFILSQARKRMKRAGIENVQFLENNNPALKQIKKKMDWVLVDVPCSGTGTLRRNPDQKWKFTLDLLKKLIGLQRNIFEQALSYVKPGGKIVYATCSLLKEENERQVDFFLKNYPLELVDHPFSSHPCHAGMDGFFAAVFTRV